MIFGVDTSNATGLFSLETLPFALVIFLIYVCIPYAIAYLTWKKGYSFWLFFLTTLMCFGSLPALVAMLIVAIYLPKREQQNDVTSKRPSDENMHIAINKDSQKDNAPSGVEGTTS